MQEKRESITLKKSDFEIFLRKSASKKPKMSKYKCGFDKVGHILNFLKTRILIYTVCYHKTGCCQFRIDVKNVLEMIIKNCFYHSSSINLSRYGSMYWSDWCPHSRNRFVMGFWSGVSFVTLFCWLCDRCTGFWILSSPTSSGIWMGRFCITG